MGALRGQIDRACLPEDSGQSQCVSGRSGETMASIDPGSVFRKTAKGVENRQTHANGLASSCAWR